MCVLRLCSVFLLPLLMTGCVSLSKYNDRVEQVRILNGQVASLEETLKKSESARNGLDADLQKARENLAKLQEEHEALKTRSFAAAAAGSGENASIDAQKQEFANEMASLRARLAEADTRIRELSASLAASQEAARKVPTLEAAISDRDRRIVNLTRYLNNLETDVAQMSRDAEELSQQRNGSEEKEKAFAAIRSALTEEVGSGEIIVKEFRDKLIVSMKEQILFRSGSARISKSGQRTLNRMAVVLKKIRNNQIVVEGHTDSCAIKRKTAAKYPTNWDLAAARALNVLKHLEKKCNIDPQLLALAGYSCYLPAATNDTEKNRRLNRRIEIALVPMETSRIAYTAREKTALR